MKRKYAEVYSTTLAGGGFAGYNAVNSRYGIDKDGTRKGKALAEWWRACLATETAFRASGKFPGYRLMRATVRVDGGRAIVCQRRGRYGW